MWIPHGKWIILPLYQQLCPAEYADWQKKKTKKKTDGSIKLEHVCSFSFLPAHVSANDLVEENYSDSVVFSLIGKFIQ